MRIIETERGLAVQIIQLNNRLLITMLPFSLFLSAFPGKVNTISERCILGPNKQTADDEVNIILSPRNSLFLREAAR